MTNFKLEATRIRQRGVVDLFPNPICLAAPRFLPALKIDLLRNYARGLFLLDGLDLFAPLGTQGTLPNRSSCGSPYIILWPPCTACFKNVTYVGELDQIFTTESAEHTEARLARKIFNYSSLARKARLCVLCGKIIDLLRNYVRGLI